MTLMIMSHLFLVMMCCYCYYYSFCHVTPILTIIADKVSGRIGTVLVCSLAGDVVDNLVRVGRMGGIKVQMEVVTTRN